MDGLGKIPDELAMKVAMDEAIALCGAGGEFCVLPEVIGDVQDLSEMKIAGHDGPDADACRLGNMLEDDGRLILPFPRSKDLAPACAHRESTRAGLPGAGRRVRPALRLKRRGTSLLNSRRDGGRGAAVLFGIR